MSERTKVLVIDDARKTKAQLITELNDLRCFVAAKDSGKPFSNGEDRFETAFLKNSTPMAITAIRDGRYMDVNEAFATIMGMKREKIIGNTSTSIGYINGEQRTIFLNELNTKGYVENLELLTRTKGGELRYGLFNSSSIKIRGKDYLFTVVTDITNRKQAEEALQQAHEELIRSEKLAMLGAIAAGMGNELRNPLGVMNNAVYFLKTVLPDADDTIKEYLDIIRTEISKSEHIINDLLDSVLTRTPQKMPVTAGELIEKSLGGCSMPENIYVQTNIPDTLPQVNIDHLQIGQVLRNLITNGIQAMPNGGTLRISARLVSSFKFQVQSSKFRIETLNLKPQTASEKLETSNLKLETDFVEIAITDTGEGISAENMEKLFQPLFTTKARGIGLGLVVCKNLVEANGGAIVAASELEKGATFTVILPVEGEIK